MTHRTKSSTANPRGFLRSRMWTATRVVGASALAAIVAMPAHADVASEAPCAETAVIPAHYRQVTRTVEVPAVMRTVKVPRYEIKQVPVFETKRTPRYRQVSEPVYATRAVTTYRTERIPRYGWTERTSRDLDFESTSITLPNPFACDCDFDLPFLPKPAIECKTERCWDIIGYDEQRVPCGTEEVRYIASTRMRRVLDGYDTERVQVGMRNDRYVCGFDTREVMVRPSTTREVTECVCIPARAVTVVPEEFAPDAKALPGTDVVVTEYEFDEEMKIAMASPSPTRAYDPMS